MIMDERKELTLREVQGKVDEWIKRVGGGYFGELTNMALLTEECGELARLIARIYGDQVAKSGDFKHPHDVRLDLADEMADVLWVLTCLANQTGINLQSAFEANLRKKSERDAHRFT